MTLKSVTSINFKSTVLFIVVNFLILSSRQASSVPIQFRHRQNQPNLGPQPNVGPNFQGPPQQFQDLNVLWESDELDGDDYSFLTPPIYQPIQNPLPNYIVPERTEQIFPQPIPTPHYNPYEHLPHPNPQQAQGNNYQYQQQYEAPGSNFHPTQQQQYPLYSTHEQHQQQQRRQPQPPQYRPPDIDPNQVIYHQEPAIADPYYQETRQYNNNPNIGQYQPSQNYYNPNYGAARPLDIESQVNPNSFPSNSNYFDGREPQFQPQTYYKVPDQNLPNSIEQQQRQHQELYNTHVKKPGNRPSSRVHHPPEVIRESERSYPDYSQFPEQQQEKQKKRQKETKQKYNQNQVKPITINNMKIIYSDDNKKSGQSVNIVSGSSLNQYKTTNPISEISIIYPISINNNTFNRNNNQTRSNTAIIIIEFDVSEATETLETTLETEDTETNEIVQEKS